MKKKAFNHLLSSIDEAKSMEAFKPKKIVAWVCIDLNEAVNYIHHGKKPQTDANYTVYRAEIKPIPTKRRRR